MSRFLVSLLLTGACAAIVGLVAGYYVAAVNEIPLSAGLIAIVGLILVAVALAYQTGLRAERERVGEHGRIDGPEALRQELDRSRRFGRSFVLMRFRMPDRAEHGLGDGRRPDGETVAMMLRSIDRAWSVNDDTYILLPECTRGAGQELAFRLSRALPATFMLESVEYAEFPGDGVTTGALLANMRTVPMDGDAPPVRLLRAQSDPAGPEPAHRQSS